MLMIVKIHYSAKSKVCIIIIYYHNLPQITFFFAQLKVILLRWKWRSLKMSAMVMVGMEML